MSNINVAVLGAGGMGCTVIGQLQKHTPVHQIKAYDVDADRLRYAENHFSVQGTTDLDDILADPSVKLVFVTAANHAHKELAIRSMEAGKAVLCEKPIATTIADAEEMIGTGERLGAWFQIGFELRYSRLYTKIKEWVDAGLLGDVVNTHCLYCASAYPKGQWRNTRQEGGNTFGERLSHYVDLTRWWVGSPVTEVYSACAPNVVPYTEVHDNYQTTYRFASGAVSHLSYFMNYPETFHGDPLAGSITDQQLGDGHKLRYIVVGTKGAAETDVFHRLLKRWAFTDTSERLRSDWVEDLTWDAAEDHFYYHNTTDQTMDVVRRVTEGLPPATPARDALETMRLCFAAEESAATGRRAPLPNRPIPPCKTAAAEAPLASVR